MVDEIAPEQFISARNLDVRSKLDDQMGNHNSNNPLDLGIRVGIVDQSQALANLQN